MSLNQVGSGYRKCEVFPPSAPGLRARVEAVSNCRLVFPCSGSQSPVCLFMRSLACSYTEYCLALSLLFKLLLHPSLNILCLFLPTCFSCRVLVGEETNQSGGLVQF